MKTGELKIDGMGCGHCVTSVKKELEKLNSVIIEKVEIGSAIIQYDESIVSNEDISKAIDKAGFKLKESLN